MTEVIEKTFNDNPTVKAFSIVGGVATAGLWTTALVYMGIYAYNNPDPKACWVVRDLHSAWTSKADAIARADAMDIDVTSGFPMEMHSVFITWFLWGFWSKISLVIAMTIGFGVYKLSDYFGQVLMWLAVGLYAAQGVVWLGVGGVWRFSKGGMVASGDELARRTGITSEVWQQQVEAAQTANGYQIASGRFINIYLMVMVFVVFFTIIGFIVGCLWLCCCDPRREKADYNSIPQNDGDEESDQQDHGQRTDMGGFVNQLQQKGKKQLRNNQ